MFAGGMNTRGPFYQHESILFTACIRNHMPSYVGLGLGVCVCGVCVCVCVGGVGVEGWGGGGGGWGGGGGGVKLPPNVEPLKFWTG